MQTQLVSDWLRLVANELYLMAFIYFYHVMFEDTESIIRTRIILDYTNWCLILYIDDTHKCLTELLWFTSFASMISVQYSTSSRSMYKVIMGFSVKGKIYFYHFQRVVPYIPAYKGPFWNYKIGHISQLRITWLV